MERDSRGSWFFLGTAFFALCIIYGACISGGLLNAYLLDVFYESRSFTSLPFALISSCLLVGGILVTPITNRYGCHVTLALGSLVAASGMAVSAYASGITFLIFSYGLLTGIGLSWCFFAANVAIGQLFDRYRTIAYGISSTGIVSGVILFPPLVHLLSDLYTWRGCFLVLSGLSLNILIPAVLLLNNRPVSASTNNKHADEKTNRTLVGASELNINIFGSTEIMTAVSTQNLYQLRVDDINNSVKSLPASFKTPNSASLLNSPKKDSIWKDVENSDISNKNTSTNKWFHWNIFRKKAFVILTLAFFCRAWGKNSWMVHITAIGLHTALDYDEAPNVLLVTGCVQLVARPAASLLANYFSSKKILIWSIAATFEGIWIIMGVLLSTRRNLFYLYIGMFGVGDAFVDTLWAPVILDTVGEESLSSALGIVGLIYGIGHVTAPSLSGLMFDRFKSYDGTFYLGGMSYILAGIFSCVAAIIKSMNNKPTLECETVSVT